MQTPCEPLSYPGVHPFCIGQNFFLPTVSFTFGSQFSLPGVSIQKAIEELLICKRAANRRAVYVDSLAGYLKRFAQGRDNIAVITAHEIEKWLTQFPRPYSRQTWLNRISTLFSFARRRGWINTNPCDAIDRVTIDRQRPVIVTVEQSRKLLSTTPNNCQPYLILGMFAGIRPDEICRLDWRDVCLKTNTVRVEGKTRTRRIVSLEPIASQLLEEFKKDHGPVTPTRSILRTWKRKSRALLGGKWTADILRHSFASYAIALIGDIGKVASMMGNSPGILQQHYHSPVTLDAAVRFFDPNIISQSSLLQIELL